MRVGDDAVANERLRVIGVEELRVVDSSIMPAIPGADSNVPTVTEWASDPILEDRSLV